MNILTKLASIVIGGTLVLTGSPARSDQTIEDHKVLWKSLNSVGVTTLLNEPTVCDRGSDGLYYSRATTLVVCQDNASKTSSEEVGWTDNDLDTFRHEAHHVLQDCLAGTLGDSETKLLFDTEESFEDFVSARLTRAQIISIINNYRIQGAPEDVIIKEIEAFAVARSVSPLVIADAIDNSCLVNK